MLYVCMYKVVRPRFPKKDNLRSDSKPTWHEHQYNTTYASTTVDKYTREMSYTWPRYYEHDANSTISFK